LPDNRVLSAADLWDILYIVLFANIYCIIIYIYVYLVSQTLTNSEIIDAVLGHKLNESEYSGDSNGSVDEENEMTVAEAISCCDNLINFMERKSFTTEQEIMQMYGLKRNLRRKGVARVSRRH
jgi:hypothetical protein